VGEGTTVELQQGGRRIIERPRLTRLLDESESRVMLLVAPAGYGKTTLARQWLRDRRHVWYQATRASSDVAAFALGLSQASHEVVPGLGQHLRTQLKSIGDVGDIQLARSLGTSLAADAAEWPANTPLVIDDYHVLASAGAAEAFAGAFIDATAMPVVVTSRSRPSWVSAKRLLYGDVAEFGRNVLAMTHEEAAQALAHAPDEMAGLVALAEGWPAVIGLAALMASPVDARAPEAPEMLHRYFAEELYHEMPSGLKWNLAQLSLAASLDHDIARTMFGDQAASILERGFRAGFLTPSPSGYEMHPLLRRFLRTKLSEFDAVDVDTTARRVAAAYVERALWDEAALVAEEFRLPDVILRVLEGALESALSEGRTPTVERWLSQVRVAAPTAPIVRFAEIELAFRTGAAQAARDKAADLVRSIEPGDPLASRVYLRAGQIAHLDDRLEEALRLFSEAEREAGTPTELRRALWSRFVTLTDLDDKDGADVAVLALAELPPLSVDDLLRANQARLQAAVRWGGLTAALNAPAAALELVDRSSDPFARTGFLQTYGVGLVLCARYAEADVIAARELDEAQRFKLDWVVPHALEMRATAAVGQRDFRRALQTLTRIRKLAAGNAHTELNAEVLRARIHLCNAAPERALAVLRNRERDATSPGMQGDCLATIGLALACCGRTTEADHILDASEAATTQLEARVLSAFARVVATRPSVDSDLVDIPTLSRACNIAIEAGNFDAFVNAYRACPALIPHLSAADTDARLFLDLVARLDPSLAETFGLQRPSVRRRSGDLTARERDVLELVQQGLTNRQIARTLWIAESTVKVHIRHVFEKLGVKSRTEAASVATDVL
jgi:LuxR family maltose regulon positive regulatory protein